MLHFSNCGTIIITESITNKKVSVIILKLIKMSTKPIKCSVIISLTNKTMSTKPFYFLGKFYCFSTFQP